MVDTDQLNEILGELNRNENLTSSVVVSRSGMHIGGEVPEGVHLETFVAMSAILLGSAETAISELRGDMEHVLVELERSRVVIVSAGSKALLVVVTNTKENFPTMLEEIGKSAKEIANIL